MHGSIEVKSELGKGTEFTVMLDFERVDVLDKCTSIPAVTSSKLYGRRVLLCEDNAMNREIAAAILHSRGIETIFAANGEEGVETFSRLPAGYFDAVLMDLRMPVMDGLSAAKHIRALSRPDAATIPVIALSADAYESDRENSRLAGMNGHIAKPIDPEELFRVLGEVWN